MLNTDITSLDDLEFYLEYIIARHPIPNSEYEKGYLEGLRYVLSLLEDLNA